MLAPVVVQKKREQKKYFEKIQKKDGYVRVRVDGEDAWSAEELDLKRT